MALKMSNSLPEIINTGNPEIDKVLTQFKLALEEVISKAKSVQTQIRTVNPSSQNDFEIEGEDVRTATREYTLVNGVAKYKALT